MKFKQFILEAAKLPKDVSDRINDTLRNVLHTTPAETISDALDKTKKTGLSSEVYQGSSRAARMFEGPPQRIHIKTKEGLKRSSIETILKHPIKSHIQTGKNEPIIGVQQSLTEVGASKMVRPKKDSKTANILKGPAGSSYSVADFKGLHPDGAPKFKYNPHGCLLPPVPSKNHEGYGRDGSWVHMFKVTPADSFSSKDRARFEKHFGFDVEEIEDKANSHAALNGYTFSGVDFPPSNPTDKESHRLYHQTALKNVTKHGMKQLANLNDLRQQRGIGDFHPGNVGMPDKHWPFSEHPPIVVLDGGYTNPRVGGGGTGTYYGDYGTPHQPMHLKGRILKRMKRNPDYRTPSGTRTGVTDERYEK